MKTPLTLALVVVLSTGAAHASGVTTPSKLHLLDASEGQLDPVAHAKTDLFLLGLGLTLGGLVLGAGGFAFLYACREGTSCHSETNTYIGYGLAAPGLLPLAAGLIILYLFTGGRHGSTDASDVLNGNKPAWALALVPLSGGGMVGASGRF